MKSKFTLLCLTLLLVGVIFSGSALAQTDDPLVEAARAKALELVGGEPIGGTVSMLGVLGGAELETFQSFFAPFEEATGITVEYESTRDIGAVLQTRIDGGNPPDVTSTPNIGQMMALADAGALVDVSPFFDMDDLRENYDSGLIDLFNRDGAQYGLIFTVNLEGLIWYNVNTYTGPTDPADWAELEAWTQETAAGGTAPWCIGLESGAASGWPASAWISQLMLLQSGPEAYQAWWQGTLPWTSPEVRRAFETYGAIATDPALVNGGGIAALATNFANGADGAFTDPPSCYLTQQASFMGSIIVGNFPDMTPIDDVNFFPHPSFDPEFANLRPISGEVMAVFNDTPQTRAFLTYFASAEVQSLLAASGSWMSANKLVTADLYPQPFTRKAAEVLGSASGVYYDAGGLMPQTLVDAFWRGILTYTQDASQLDAVLADLDRVQAEAYSS